MSKKGGRIALHRCQWQHGAERCSEYALGTSDYCDAHTLNMAPNDAAEAHALGPEAAAAVRAELGVAAVVPAREVRRREAMTQQQQADPEVTPEQARDPIKYAMKIALDAVADAYARDNEERASGRARGQRLTPTERARMTLAAYMPQMDDLSAIEPGLVKPGWIARWVRIKDEDGRPNTRRLRRFLAEGAEEVMDADGRPLLGPLGKAIQIPPQMYAIRVLHHSPAGAFDSSPYVQSAIEMGEHLNRQVGQKVVDVRPGPEHGSRRGEGW